QGCNCAQKRAFEWLIRPDGVAGDTALLREELFAPPEISVHRDHARQHILNGQRPDEWTAGTRSGADLGWVELEGIHRVARGGDDFLVGVVEGLDNSRCARRILGEARGVDDLGTAPGAGSPALVER